MPEYQKNHIPINDSHFGTKKESSQLGVNARSGRAAETPRTNASRSISPRAASFLLFWGIVAVALIIYWELSKADGVDHAKTIGHETEAAPSQKTPETKNLATSQRAKNHPTPQKINSSIGKGKSSVSTPKFQAVNTSGIWVGKWKIEGYLVNPLSPSEKGFKLSIEQKGSELTGVMAYNGTKGTSGLIGNIEYINEKNQIAFEYKYSDGMVMTYTGTVNNQGNEAKGKWTSTGRYSGSWKMVKMKEPIQGAQQEAFLPRGTNRSMAPEQAKKAEKEKITGRKVTHSLPTGKNVKALQEKARELARQGKWAEAAKLAEQVVDKAPRSLKDRRFFGLYLLSASQYPRGIQELEAVNKDGQTDVVVEHHLGHAYYKVGSYDKALNAFQKAITIDPANPRHYKCGARMIVDALRLKPSFNGNLTLARTWYEKALALGMQPAELAGIKRMLEKIGLFVLNPDY